MSESRKNGEEGTLVGQAGGGSQVTRHVNIRKFHDNGTLPQYTSEPQVDGLFMSKPRHLSNRKHAKLRSFNGGANHKK